MGARLNGGVHVAVYDGVVHTKQSERDGEPRLAEGTCVEVRAPMTDAVTGAADVIRLLRAEGLSEEPPTASDGAQHEQFESRLATWREWEHVSIAAQGHQE